LQSRAAASAAAQGDKWVSCIAVWAFLEKLGLPFDPDNLGKAPK
jgi:hypothetical protein